MRTLALVGLVLVSLAVGCSRSAPTPAPVDPPAPVADVKPPQTENTPYTKAFDQLWADMDRNYSYFDHKKVDWLALKAQYRPRAEAAKSTDEFIAVLKPLLAELKDEHIRIEGPAGRVYPHQGSWERNWSIPGIQPHMATGGMVGKFVSIGRMKEGFGLLHVEDQLAATPELVQKTVERIEALGDVPGFIVDLRPAFGGNEAHSMPVASAFCAKPTVYAKHKFRNGPGHTDFTTIGERTLPAGKKPFTKPVVVLLGSATVSSGEALALMLAALPHVTTVGSTTRGASGNPMPVELKDVGLTVYYSRWVSLLPDGTPLEGRGVIPQVEAKFPATAFGAKDPVLEKAIEVLRAKVK